MRGLARRLAVALLETLLEDLRETQDGDPAQEMPSIMTGPEALVEMSGQRGDELLHAEARRARWHSEDEIHDRAHGTRKIGF